MSADQNKSSLSRKLHEILEEVRGRPNTSVRTQKDAVNAANAGFKTNVLSHRTVEKWFSGESTPRNWYPFLMFLAGLEVSRTEANQLLSLAQLPPIHDLSVDTSKQPSEIDVQKRVLEYWRTQPIERTKPPAIKPLPTLPSNSRMSGYHPNQHFVGRQQHLERIFEHMQTSRGVIITGTQGVGKTQLAVQFAYEYAKEHFPGGVFFINCSDLRNVDVEIAACGDKHGLNLSTEYDSWQLTDRVTAVKRMWGEDVPRLLIFDNVEASSEVNVEEWLAKHLIPNSGGSRVILTTTKLEWTPALPLAVEHIKKLDRAESITFLSRLANKDISYLTADSIANELADLPLLLYNAGCYLRQLRYTETAESYLAGLQQEESVSFLPDTLMSPTYHDPNIDRSYLISFNKLNPSIETDRLAIQLLGYLAYLSPGDPVPLSLINLYFTHLQAQDQLFQRIEYILQPVLDLGFVDVSSGALTMHRVLARFIRQQVAQPINLYTALAYSVAPKSNVELSLHWLPHIRFLARYITKEQTDYTAALAAKLTPLLLYCKDYATARYLLEWAYDIQKNSLHTLPSDMVYTLHYLGYLSSCDNTSSAPYDSSERLEKGFVYYQEALQLHHQLRTPDSPLRARTLNNLGTLFLRYGKLAEARQYLQEAFEIRKKNHGPLGIALNNLGLLEFLEADIDDRAALESALDLLQQGLEDKRSHPMLSTPLEYVSLHSRIGVILHALGNTAQANKMFEEGMRTCKSAYPSSSFEPGYDWYTFAVILKNNGKYAQARLIAIQALELLQNAVGEDGERSRQLVNQLLSEIPLDS